MSAKVAIGVVALILAFAGLHALNRGTDKSQSRDLSFDPFKRVGQGSS